MGKEVTCHPDDIDETRKMVEGLKDGEKYTLIPNKGCPKGSAVIWAEGMQRVSLGNISGKIWVM